MSAEEWTHRVECAKQQNKTHHCCVDGCEQDTLWGFLACREHWLALPHGVRAILGAAFRRHETDPDIYAEAVTIARRLLNEQAVA